MSGIIATISQLFNSNDNTIKLDDSVRERSFSEYDDVTKTFDNLDLKDKAAEVNVSDNINIFDKSSLGSRGSRGSRSSWDWFVSTSPIETYYCSSDA